MYFLNNLSCHKRNKDLILDMFNKTTNFLLIFILSFFMTSCAQKKVENMKVDPKPTISESKKKSVLEKKSCKEKSRIITSNKRFIKFRHDVNEVEEYKEIAANWCMKFSKIPKKSKVRCSRCCDASYFCK